jgi:hypothetical protein
VACRKGKISRDQLLKSEMNTSWIWLSVSKSQAKSLPKFNGLEAAENFKQLQIDIKTHFNHKGHLNNMVLRVKIEVNTNGVSEPEIAAPGTGRPVSVFAVSSEHRLPPTGSSKLL